ncbi:hypothetical protein TNCV_2859011 [Trichonephila clavipes]|nr:hypothetical protein TNCV_2859011 [Trichonephila clavipes]
MTTWKSSFRLYIHNSVSKNEYPETVEDVLHLSLLMYSEIVPESWLRNECGVKGQLKDDLLAVRDFNLVTAAFRKRSHEGMTHNWGGPIKREFTTRKGLITGTIPLNAALIPKTPKTMALLLDESTTHPSQEVPRIQLREVVLRQFSSDGLPHSYSALIP